MTKKACVIGWPLSHTKSPLIHTHWLQQHGLDGSYVARPIAPEVFESEIKKLIEEGFAGFNITVPHKQSILPLLKTIHPSAAAIGAVNTVIIHNDGTLEGRNTDAFGFMANLKANAPGFDFKKGPAIVLGAGGAARAVVYALGQEGVTDIRIYNRTLDRAAELAGAFPGATAHAWGDVHSGIRQANFLVNTTSLGMKGQPALDVDLAALPKGTLVHDIVYTPLTTDLLAAAQKQGNQTVTGIGMLLHQARPAFEAWFGILPDVDEALKAKVLA